jgi:small-conductance mechanosensitive channel
MALLLFAWLVAKLFEKASNKLFILLGIDKLSHKAGIAGFLISSGLPSNLSYILARIIFWSVIVLFFLPISNILGLKFFSGIVDEILAFLPNLFVAIFILLVGSWGAKVISGIVRGSANRMGLDNSELLGTIINFFILIVTFIIALTQLKIETEILTNILLILIASIGLAVAISFGIGSKDIFKNIIAGVYLNKTLHEGEFIKINETEGKIIHIGAILTKIETSGNKEVSIPNNQLLDSTIN